MAKTVNKRYVANNRRSLTMGVRLQSGQSYTIEFFNGYGLRNEGYFLTNNVEVQEALESDPRFNKSYRLEEIDNVNIAEYNALQELKKRKVVVPAEEPKAEVITAETPAEPVDEVVAEESKNLEFDNAQTAKNFLNKEHGVPFSQMKNKAAILKSAEELGFKIVFKNDQN